MTKNPYEKDSVELFFDQYESGKTVQESISLAIDWLTTNNLSESI
jgi:hypothetical protein